MSTRSDGLPKAVTRELKAGRADAHRPGNYIREMPLRGHSGSLSFLFPQLGTSQSF